MRDSRRRAVTKAVTGPVQTNDKALKISEQSAWWGLVGNVLLTVLKVLVGIAGHSAALVADGVHSAADSASSLAIVVGLRIAQRPADSGHNYGHGKAEAVAQKVVAFLLIGAGFELCSQAVAALFRGPGPQPDLWTLIVAGLVTLLKEWLFRTQRRTARQTGSHALMAAAADNRGDVVSSGVATAGIVGARLGIVHCDEVGALAVGLLVSWLGVSLFAQAANDLMDRAASTAMSDRLHEAAGRVEGVIAVGQLKTRMMGARILVDIEVTVAARLNFLQAWSIAQAVEAMLLKIPEVSDVNVRLTPGEAAGMPQGRPYGKLMQ